MLSQKTIKEAKDRSQIVDIIKQKVKLESKGNKFLGLCPFHQETTPSFYVWPEQNRYYCFGCQANGDIFNFLMESEGLTFTAAVEKVAELYGVPILKEGKKSGSSYSDNKFSTNSLKKQLLGINLKSLLYFRESLKFDSGVVKDYLRERGLTRELINQFNLGFAPLNGLVDFLKLDEEVLFTAGLLKRSSSGKVFESYQNRLIFPIFNPTKELIGFAGRTIPQLNYSSKAAKYINSAETPLYSKKKVLYGLDEALPEIRRSKIVYVVEGYFDVIALHRAGLKNCVATCGTALTQEHALELSRHANKIFLLFDSDAAGRRAAIKAFSSFIGCSVDVKVIVLPENEDPDSLLRDQGVKASVIIKEKLKRINLTDFFLNSVISEYGANANELDDNSRLAIVNKLHTYWQEMPTNLAKAIFLEATAIKLKFKVQQLERSWQEIDHKKVDNTTINKKIQSESVVHTKRLIKIKQEDNHFYRNLTLGLFALKHEFPNTIFKELWYIEVINQVFSDCLSSILTIYENTSNNEELQKSALNDYLAETYPYFKKLYKEFLKLNYSEVLRLKSTFFDTVFELEHRLPKIRKIKELENELKMLRSDSEKAEVAVKIIELKKAI
jgi:DNA primase